MASQAEIELLKLMSGAGDVARRRSRAEALMGEKAPQAQMVGGRYIAPSGLGMLANALARGVGGYQQSVADKEQAQVDQKMVGGLGGIVDREQRAAGEASRIEAEDRRFKRDESLDARNARENQMAETARQNAWERSQPRGAWSAVPGADLAMDARTGNTKAMQFVHPAGGRGGAGGGPRLQQGDKDALQTLAGELANVDRLRKGFKDDYAGGGPIANAGVSLAQKAGSLASPGSQAKAAWWSDFQMLVEMPQRNKLFGASLTPGEQAAWKSAQNIKPGGDPAIARQKMDELYQIAERKMANRSDSLKADGYRPDAVDALVRGPAAVAQPQAAPAAQSAPVKVATAAPVRKVINGKTYELENGKLYEVD